MRTRFFYSQGCLEGHTGWLGTDDLMGATSSLLL
jgi:hypothetical protein